MENTALTKMLELKIRFNSDPEQAHSYSPSPPSVTNRRQSLMHILSYTCCRQRSSPDTHQPLVPRGKGVHGCSGTRSPAPPRPADRSATPAKTPASGSPRRRGTQVHGTPGEACVTRGSHLPPTTRTATTDLAGPR